MIKFLQGRGYTIKAIKTWSSYNTYHNQVENNYKDEIVAYVGDFDVFNFDDGTYRDLSIEKYKLKSVFSNELKSKLLQL